MRRKSDSIVLCALFIITIASFSCAGDMPYAKKYWWRYSQDGGPWVYNNTKFTDRMAPGVVLDCEDGSSGCQGKADWFGFAYDDVNVIRTTLDTFYSKYFTTTLPSWLTRSKLNYLFPDLESMRPGAIDSLLNGNYRFWVTGDSSIIVGKAPLDSLGFSNAVWVVDCDGEIAN